MKQKRLCRRPFMAAILILIAVVAPAFAADLAGFKAFTRVQIKDASGADVWEFKGKNDGCKVVDARERELFCINRTDRKLKITNPDDSVVGYVLVQPGQIKVIDAIGKNELFELQRQPNGDWKWKNATDKLMQRIKKRDYGFEVESPTEQSLFKSKLKDGKVSLRDANDKTEYASHDTQSTLAMTCMSFDAPLSNGLKAGLIAAVLWFEPTFNNQQPNAG